MTQPVDPPLFMFGVPRSGTTILARVLSAHPDVEILHELRLVEIALSVGRMLTGTAADERDPARLAGAVEAGAPVARTLLANRKAAAGVRWIGDKFPDYAGTVIALDRIFPGYRAILVVRDGRDVAQSLRTTATNKRAWRIGAQRLPFALALDRWVERMELSLNAAARLGDRLHILRYEDAAAHPDEVCAAFEQFLGLQASDELRAAMRGVKARHDWRWTLSAAEQKIAAEHPKAARMLAMLGYPPTPPPPEADVDTPERCLERAEQHPEHAILEWCRALDGEWGATTRAAAHRLAAQPEAPEALFALAHLVERGKLADPADRQVTAELLAARGLPPELARAVVGGA